MFRRRGSIVAGGATYNARSDTSGSVTAGRALERENTSRDDLRVFHMSDEVRGATDDALHAGQILDGAKMIAKYLIHLGFADMTEKKVFHWAADGRLPVKKIGNRLVANKGALLRHFGLA
jgi:hypothetical protein